MPLEDAFFNSGLRPSLKITSKLFHLVYKFPLLQFFPYDIIILPQSSRALDFHLGVLQEVCCISKLDKNMNLSDKIKLSTKLKNEWSNLMKMKKFKIYWFLIFNCKVSTWEARSLWTSVLRHNQTRNLLNKARLNQKPSKQNKIKPETF